MKDKNIEERTTLRLKHSKARELILKQINEGKILQAYQINTKDKLNEIQHQYSKWTKYNFHLLEMLFSDSKYASEYSTGLGIYKIRKRTLAEEVNAFKEDVSRKTSKLDSIENSLDLFEFKKENTLFTFRRITIGGLGILLAVFVILFGDNILFRLTENIPILSHQSKSDIIYSIIEKDSIFKDSMFGEIPFKGFHFEISNIGDIQADNISIRLNSFNGMDLGYDPNLMLIGNPSAGEINIESRLFHRRLPLAPQASTWLKLSMFRPAYDSLNNLHNNKNSATDVPSIYIEYSEGIAKKVPVKRID